MYLKVTYDPPSTINFFTLVQTRTVSRFLGMYERDLGGRRFDSNEGANNGVHQWLFSHALSFYKEGIENCFSHYYKCLN